MLIQEVKESSGSAYQLHADLIECNSPKGHRQLIFYSVWTGAKNSKEHQKKCEFLLGEDAIDNLRNLLDLS